MKNLDYYTLLSPEPVMIDNVGSIKSPTLREIAKIGYYKYQLYTSILLMDLEKYYSMTNGFRNKNPPENFIQSDVFSDIKTAGEFFDMLILNPSIKDLIIEILNFFIIENVIFSPDFNSYMVYNNDSELIGYINRDNYFDVIDIILQRINIKKASKDNKKIRNRTAERVLKKLSKADGNKKNEIFELGNIVSALATHSKNLNILNIWDLTVYQLYDQFSRQQIDDSDSMQKISVSVWGDKENHFDGTLWFKLINKN